MFATPSSWSGLLLDVGGYRARTRMELSQTGAKVSGTLELSLVHMENLEQQAYQVKGTLDQKGQVLLTFSAREAKGAIEISFEGRVQSAGFPCQGSEVRHLRRQGDCAV